MWYNIYKIRRKNAMNDEHDFEEERDEEREEAYGDEQEERHDKEPA